MKKCNKLTISFLGLLLSVVACTQDSEKHAWHHVELYPLDSSQVVTVITAGGFRYILNGRHQSIPGDEYIKLDVSQVDALGDGISICWDKENSGWKIASAYAILLESTLDTVRFKFSASKGDLGEPRIGPYANDNCGGFLIREYRKARGNLRVEYHQ